MRKPPDSNSKRPTSGSVTIDGVTATRTRKPFSASSKRTPEDARQSKLGALALKLHYFEKVPQHDIAVSFGLTQGRISQLIDKEWKRQQAERSKLVEEARPIAVAECYHHAHYWAKRAQSDPKASEVMLSWLTRADKIQGLYLERHELSLSANGKPDGDEPPYDLRRLSDEQFAQLELILMVAAGTAPEPQPAQDVVIGPYTKAIYATPCALIEQQPDDSIVAVQPADETLRDKILKLHTQGMAASAIAETLAITRSALLAALENPTTPGASIQ